MERLRVVWITMDAAVFFVLEPERAAMPAAAFLRVVSFYRKRPEKWARQ